MIQSHCGAVFVMDRSSYLDSSQSRLTSSTIFRKQQILLGGSQSFPTTSAASSPSRCIVCPSIVSNETSVSSLIGTELGGICSDVGVKRESCWHYTGQKVASLLPRTKSYGLKAIPQNNSCFSISTLVGKQRLVRRAGLPPVLRYGAYHLGTTVLKITSIIHIR